MTSLQQRLHSILVTLRKSFEANLPDPAELTHGGQATVGGVMCTTQASVPLDEITHEEKFTVYMHCTGERERVHYFHFEGRKELSCVYVRLEMVEDSLRQSVTLSSLPREIFVQMVERRLGRGAPREKRHRGGKMMDRRGGGGRQMNEFNRRPPREPMPMEPMTPPNVDEMSDEE